MGTWSSDCQEALRRNPSLVPATRVSGGSSPPDPLALRQGQAWLHPSTFWRSEVTRHCQHTARGRAHHRSEAGLSLHARGWERLGGDELGLLHTWMGEGSGDQASEVGRVGLGGAMGWRAGWDGAGWEGGWGGKESGIPNGWLPKRLWSSLWRGAVSAFCRQGPGTLGWLPKRPRLPLWWGGSQHRLVGGGLEPWDGSQKSLAVLVARAGSIVAGRGPYDLVRGGAA